MNIKKHTRNNFTVINNNIFMDRTLSFKAKGLLCQLLSLPDTWKFTEKGLVALSTDGMSSVRSAIKELENAKYLHRERVRGTDGLLSGTIYHIYEEPFEVEENNYIPMYTECYYDWMSE